MAKANVDVVGEKQISDDNEMLATIEQNNKNAWKFYDKEFLNNEK